MMCFKRPFWILLLIFLLLPGCGRKLDPETLALIEASDAACLVTAEEAWLDDSGSIRRLKCRVRTDFLGSLGSPKVQHPLPHISEKTFIYVAVEEEWYEANCLPVTQAHEAVDLLLFLTISPEEKVLRWSGSGAEVKEYALFLPNGEDGLQLEPRDAAGLRLLKALGAYGKTHPRDPLTDAVVWD